MDRMKLLNILFGITVATYKQNKEIEEYRLEA